MILICGGSWAVGEWPVNDNTGISFKDTPKDLSQYYRDKSLCHGGLSQYLKEDGHEVVNVGFAGANNLASVIALRSALNILTKFNKVNTQSITVIFFQTEWFQELSEYKHPVIGGPNLRESISEDLIYKSIDYWQNQLVQLANDYNIKIHLVGGASDTMWADNFEQRYPGLSILCQSLINLCVNNTSRVENPVFGIRYPDELVDVAKSLCRTTKDLEYLIEKIDQGLERFNQFDAHLEYFWPDGMHPNRAGHRKLYELVKEKLL